MTNALAREKGFTLVETLVAVSIITIAIVGPLLTASRALVAAYTARDQLTASYLAQEGAEYVRLMRDSIYLADYQTEPSDPRLAQDAFNDFAYGGQTGSVVQCLGAGDGSTLCALADPLAPMGIGANNALRLCGSACPALSLISSSGVARYTTDTSGTATPFTRTLRFYRLGDEIGVTVTVSWPERGSTYSTSVTDYLSPWQ